MLLGIEYRGEPFRRFTSVLSDEQVKTLMRRRFIDVISNKGQRWRVVINGISGNLYLMEGLTGDVAVGNICAHPAQSQAHFDSVWEVFESQYLWLRCDEDAVIDVGNGTKRYMLRADYIDPPVSERYPEDMPDVVKLCCQVCRDQWMNRTYYPDTMRGRVSRPPWERNPWPLPDEVHVRELRSLYSY